MELKDYLRVLRRRWPVVLLIWAAVMLIHAALVKQETQRYQATAEIVIKEPQFFYITGADLALPYFTVSPETRYSLLKSEPVLSKAVGYLWTLHEQLFPFRDAFVFDVANAAAQEKDTGREIKGQITVQGAPLPYLRSKMADYVEYLRASVKVDKQRETQIVLITAEDTDRLKAEYLADCLAFAFKEYMLDDSRAQVNKACDTLEHLIEKKSEEIEKVEKEVSQARTKLEGEINTPGGSLEALQDKVRFTELGKEILHLELQIKDLAAKIINPPAAMVEALPEGTVLHQMRVQLDSLQAGLAQDQAHLMPAHPAVRRKQQQIDDLERRIPKLAGDDLARRKNAVVKGLGDSVEEKGNDLKALRQERDDLVKRLAASQPGGAMQAVQVDLSLKEERLKIANTERTNFLARQSNILLSQSMEPPLVDILAEAKEGRPLSKTTQSSWPFLLLVGCLVGVGSAYFLEYMSSTIRTESDVKRYLNLQVMGAVLRIKEPDQRLLLTVAPKQPLHEVYNMIGALVDSYAVEHKAKVFMVASSRAEEGKSTVTTNLGIALAKGGERVILIDCDLRKAVLHRFLSVDNSKGLTAALLAEREAGEGAQPVPIEGLVRSTEVEGLQVIPAGPHPQNPVGLLKSEAFRRVLREAREQADVILVDVPPVNLAVDPLVLAPLMDGILLLVSAGEVTKDEVTHAKRLIESARGKLIGCVLNKVSLEGRGYYYYYYHYYYDAYKAYRES